MKFTATREQIISARCRRSSAWSNASRPCRCSRTCCCRSRASRLSVTGTDLEVELVASGEVNVGQPGEITVPGRKLLEIAKALPEKSTVTVTLDGDG